MSKKKESPKNGSIEVFERNLQRSTKRLRALGFLVTRIGGDGPLSEFDLLAGQGPLKKAIRLKKQDDTNTTINDICKKDENDLKGWSIEVWDWERYNQEPSVKIYRL